jgi:TonB-dependent starch-binding outer membrane protein SusC
MILFTVPWNGFSQDGGSVSGVVKDPQNEPLPGVSVIIKGTTKGTTTDVNGKFSIQMNEDESTLVFSFVGFKPQEVSVRNQTQITVTLIEDVSTLDEIVVIGYGEAKKSDLTGSVAQVKSSSLSPSISSSVDNLLKGRAAGLQVMSSSGQPGAGTTIRIRGTNSFQPGASNPLLVVDGIPVGDAGNLKQINPLDIETIDVLKDASATAIYGSRGSNGVIMITTKKGKDNQGVIEGNYQVGISTLQKSFDIISDPYLYAQLTDENAGNLGLPKRYIGQVNPENGIYYPSLSEINNGTWNKKTYWPDQVFQNAITQNASIAARGGNDYTKYSVSFGYLNQKGMVIGNAYHKYTTNLNLEQKIRKNLKTGATINLAFINEEKGSTSGWMAGAVGRNPVFPIYDDNGNYFKMAINDFGNPVAVRNLVKDENKTFDLFGTAYIDWEIIKGLSVRSNIRSTYGASVSDYYEPIGFGGSGNQYNGEGRIGNYQGLKWVFDNYVTYNKTINDVHKLTAMIGSSYEKGSSRTSNLTGRDFVNNFLENESLGSAKTRVISNGYSRVDFMSYFGRLMYNYDDRYLLTATVRADGVSKFGADNKYAYFPSMAAAWNLHKEAFFPQTEIVSTFKIRAGYGLTGNQAGLDSYRTLDRFSNTLYWMDGAWSTGYGPGYVSSVDQQGRSIYEGIPNTGLKWETTRQVNVGFDADLFHDHVRLTVDYYDKYTYDLLRLAHIAISSGYHRQWQNDGEVSNKGIEVSLDADILQRGDFKWTAGFNVSHNKSKVKDVEQDVINYNGGSYTVPKPFGATIEYFRAVPNNLAIGQPMFAFYGYKTDGIIQSVEEGQLAGLTGAEALPGEIKYVDINKDGVVDERDRTFIGNPNPKMFFGFNTSAQYKNLQLRVFLTGSYGNDVVNTQKLNQGSSQYQRWTPDNPTNDYPRLNSQRLTRFSDFFIEDGSYVKLQNISLGYNFRLKNTIVKSLQLNVNCENVWTFSSFSGYDPEVGLDNNGYGIYGGAGYARPRLYTMGVNFTF